MVSLICFTAVLVLILGCVGLSWAWRELSCLDDIDYWIDGDENDHLITQI